MRGYLVALGTVLVPMRLLSDPAAGLTCSEALEQVATLKTQQPVYQEAAQSERHFIDDADRPAELARMQKIIAATCSASPAERAAQEAQAQRLHVAMSPQCAVARDELRGMELPDAHEARDAVESKRKLVADKCPAVSTRGRWLIQWDGRGGLQPDSD